MAIPVSSSSPRRAEWLALIVLFLLAGVTRHDPWKWHEPYVFGIIHHFYQTHSWLIPTNVGVPFMEKPPLYYWVAVVCCYLFGGVLPLHEAARMASPFFMAIAAAFTWKTSQVLYAQSPDRRAIGWIAIALLLGQLGIVNDSHMMQVDIALFATVSIALYGLALFGCRPERGIQAGLWMGLGFGLVFLSKGLFMPVILGAAGIAMLMAVPGLATWRSWRTLGIAFLVALPLVTLWPYLVYLRSPALFKEWFWDNNVGRFLGFTVDRLGVRNRPGQVAIGIVSAAFPAIALVGFAGAPGKGRWRETAYLLPACVVFIGLLLLDFSATASANYFIPLFPAFALLAAPVVLQLPKRFLAGWNGVIRIAASLAAVAICLIWLNLHLPPEARYAPHLMARLARWLPLDVVPPDQTFACLAAAAMLALWLAAFRLDMRSPVATAYTWLAGLALIWVTFTLLFPWRDAEKSYRPVFMQMVAAAHHASTGPGCIEMIGYDEDIAPLFAYMVQPFFPSKKEGETCPYLFTFKACGHPPNHWRTLWHTPPEHPEIPCSDQLQLFVPK